MNTDAVDTRAAVVAPTLGTWLRIGARVAIFSAVIGVMLTLMDPRHTGLLESLVYSESIGLSIYAGYIALRVWTGPSHGRASLATYLLRGVVAVPVGFVVGLHVAAWSTGRQVDYAVLTRTANFAIPVTIVASACLMYYFWSTHRIAEAALANADAERLVAESKLKLLQAQIEPHMLFNTLANLRTLVDVEPQRAQAMIDQLIVYLRGTLAASRHTSTTLEAEFAQLGAYLALMQVRMATRLRFDLDLPDALRRAPVPPMLLQPLVENAIKHGLEPKIEGGSVHVTASVIDDRLRLEVRDDGIGLDDAASSTGYGLEHVRERLRTLYGDRGRLSIAPRPEGGVVAVVEVPR